MDRKVENFIVNGELPAEGATCKGTQMPDPGYGMMRAARVPRHSTNPLLALRQIKSLVD